MLEKELKRLRVKLSHEKSKLGKERNPERISRLNNRIIVYQKLLRDKHAA